MIKIKQVSGLQTELDKIQTTKFIIPAAAMLPMTDASAYYLEGSIPTMVFDHLTDTSVKAQLWDYEIPQAVDRIKARVIGKTADEVTGEQFAMLAVEAQWVGTNIASVTFNPSTEFRITGDEKLVYSNKTTAFSIGGTRTIGCGLWITLKRVALHNVDDLTQPLMIAWLEIEFL